MAAFAFSFTRVRSVEEKVCRAIERDPDRAMCHKADAEPIAPAPRRFRQNDGSASKTAAGIVGRYRGADRERRTVDSVRFRSIPFDSARFDRGYSAGRVVFAGSGRRINRQRISATENAPRVLAVDRIGCKTEHGQSAGRTIEQRAGRSGPELGRGATDKIMSHLLIGQ